MLRTLFLIVPFLLLFHVTSAAALPPCPTDPNAYWDNCKGFYDFGDGHTYVGEWKDNKKHGHGVLTSPSGQKYVGEFRDDERTQGIWTAPNGDQYVGGFRDGTRHGHGTYTFANGDKYVGEFRDGKSQGHGTHFWADGDVWVGQFSNDEWVSGNKYTAGNVPPEVYAARNRNTSVNEQSALPPCPSNDDAYWDNCEGTWHAPNGDQQTGEWQDDKIHGRGTVIYAKGDKYVGEYWDGKKHGHGTYTWADGAKYVGEFKNDLSHGYGTYTFANGDVWVGQFSNDEWVSGNKYTAGNVPPEVYATRGGDTPRNTPSTQQTQTPDPDEIIPATSGSSFVISKAGHIVTNHHVIDGCNQVEVHQKGNSYRATVVEIDIVNDLAVLKADFTPTTIFSINSQNAQLSQDVWVAGYPFGDALSTSVKVTKGIVSSLAGIGNNYSNMQIDAALQPGNSGGPILDEFGNVVGVAVAKLDLKISLEAFDVVPENTNFGIKSSVLKNFLDANGIATLQASEGAISTAERAKKITDGTLFLSCLMTYAQIEKLRAEKVMFSDLE